VVEDPATAEALKPWYRQLCKRPCFHDDYLDAYNLPGVHLVDTDGRGVERIDATGAWAGGEHVALDCLIFASGFEVGTPYARRCGFETTGRDGETLSEHWADGMSTLHGMHVAGFPNLFIIGHSQGANLISNITHNLTEAARTASVVIARARELGAVEVEATPEAEAAWIAPIALAERGMLGSEDCTPGYYNNEGGPIGRRERLNSGGFPQGPVAFFDHIARWRATPELPGLELRDAMGRTVQP
jgi:cation diffusion facilitator CzcD-associated flavoprotein CzcO